MIAGRPKPENGMISGIFLFPFREEVYSLQGAGRFIRGRRFLFPAIPAQHFSFFPFQVQ